MGNTGEGWGTSSAIKGNYGVSAPPLYIFLWFYFSFFKFRLAKKLEKTRKKNRYFHITANFEYQFNNFTEFQLYVLVVLNIFLAKRSLEPPPYLAATDINRQLEDVFAVLKFIFSTQRNSFSVIDFLILNLPFMHTY